MLNECFIVRMMWSAGVLAAISSISYPAISAFVSMHADADKQGLVQVSSILFSLSHSCRMKTYFLFVSGNDHGSSWSL